jgi:hypothetical protein
VDEGKGVDFSVRSCPHDIVPIIPKESCPRRWVARLVQPPEGLVAANSVIGSGRIPLKTGSVRGVVLGAGYGSDPVWLEEAHRVVLPGLRIVGEGPEPTREGWEALGSAEGVWVVRRG